MHQFRQKQHEQDNHGTSHHAGQHNGRVLEHDVREARSGLLKCSKESGRRSGQFQEFSADGVEGAVN